MKRLIVIMMVLTLVLGFCGCTGSTEPSDVSNSSTAQQSGAESAEASDAGTQVDDNWKIGIMTTTITQAEESFRVSARLAEEYPDRVLVVTYPDNFAAEQETTISTALSLASNPDVKAIIFSQAVQGTAAACEKIRELRDDILLICTGFQDAITTISEASDVFFNQNIPKMGYQIIDMFNEMGVKTVVHYSFPRHLAFQPTADRLQNMKDHAAELGMTVVEVTTPDPTSDAGVSGTQQFILEDVPRQVGIYGTQTGFFGTNASQQEPMIQMVMETGSYYAYPSDPSVFVGYASALGLDIPAEETYNPQYYEEAISAKLADAGLTGHLGCWTSPLNTFFMEGSFKYALAFCKGETNGEKVDAEVFTQCMSEAAGSEVEVDNIVADGVTYDHGFYILSGYQLF